MPPARTAPPASNAMTHPRYHAALTPTPRGPKSVFRLKTVGDDVTRISRQAHDTATEVAMSSKRKAEDRLEVARRDAREITDKAKQRVRALDRDGETTWAERERINANARPLAQQLGELADAAVARFPLHAKHKAEVMPSEEQTEVVPEPEPESDDEAA